MRVLIAEDDRQLRVAIARGLREAGYAVEQAGSGPQALSLLTEQAYDALVLDVLLPGKGGLEVCREIREKGSEMPILMLTALDAVDKRIAGLDAGADDYLPKPFDFGELLARLRAITRRQQVESDEITIGELVIDTAKRNVRRGERAIPLTAKEFEMLTY